MGGHKRHGADPLEANLPKLSAREREVVQLVSEGRASKEIAAILNVTLGTAETHRSNILRKLQLHSIAELVLYAVRNEIVHVQFPRVLTFPGQGEEHTRARTSSEFSALSKRGNGPVEVARKVVN